MNIPCFKYAINNDDSLFVDAISFVDEPAVESTVEFFKKQALFSIEGHRAITPVIRADHKILRIKNGEQYYVVFDQDTCNFLSKQLMRDCSNIRWTSNHDDSPAPKGVTLTGLFQKSPAVSVKGFDDIAEGSIFATFEVDDPSVLDDFGGVSVELYYDDLVPVDPDAFECALIIANSLDD